MAISPAVRAAIRAISYMDPDIRKTYKMSRKLSNMLSRLYTAPEDYTIWEHKVERNGYRVPVRIFSPPKPSESAIVFFHGGGWVTGNIDTYSRTCIDICAQTGQTVISVDYRLAPEHRFPCALEDCYAVLREIYAGHFEGLSPENVTIMGDSAGGNLAAAVSLLARDRGEFLPRRQILIYPATYNDHSERSPFPSVAENGTGNFLTARRVHDYMNLYLAAPDDINNPYVAPLLTEDLSRQPETLIITAELCLFRDEGEAYGRRLREAGGGVVIYREKDAPHGYFTLPPSVPMLAQTYTVIRQFLRKDASIEKKTLEPLG